MKKRYGTLSLALLILGMIAFSTHAVLGAQFGRDFFYGAYGRALFIVTFVFLIGSMITKKSFVPFDENISKTTKRYLVNVNMIGMILVLAGMAGLHLEIIFNKGADRPIVASGFALVTVIGWVAMTASDFFYGEITSSRPKSRDIDI